MPKTKSLKTKFKESSKKTAHYDEYLVDNSSDKVFMSIYPGDTGQSAVTDILLEGADPDRGLEGTVENYDLDTNINLNGRYLDVYTEITDVHGDPDLTNFEFELTGGVQYYTYKMEKTVQNQGDSIVYKMSIFFYQ